MPQRRDATRGGAGWNGAFHEAMDPHLEAAGG